MILISALTSILFLGGWLAPFSFLPSGMIWLLLKTACVLFLFLWCRATFPRYRYDQIMRLGWKVLIPVSLVWLLVVALLMQAPLRQLPIINIWFH
jgi:NADH-quinone oxidoreductase subunit H